MTDRSATNDSGAAAFDPDALREKYREERDKRLRADGNDQYVEVAGAVRPLRRRSVRRARLHARAADRRGRGGGHRRRLRRAAGRRAPARGRHRRHPHHREGRRLRRHLVLEPLPGRAVRRRVVHLPAAARRARLRADARSTPRAPEILAHSRAIGRAVRPLPRRLLPDRGDRDALGRRERALDRLDQPRRPHAGALRRAWRTGR